jgi:restriction endonuclease Mrr
MQPEKYIKFEPGTKCSVDGCNQEAEFEVYLYDYYPEPLNEEFFEQDYTCPFLCSFHMRENEANSEGERIPRGFVSYPYTNQYSAQGYTKYTPIQKVYPQFYDGSSKLLIPEVRIEVAEVNEELIRYLAKHPQLLRDLDPRKFEELVAEIFRAKGFTVELTPATRDGGRDIQAVQKNSIGTFLYFVECKRYSSSRKVGVDVVRSLYGVKQQQRATMGILVTTSSFTKDAIDFASPLEYELSLRDFEALKSWLSQYGLLQSNTKF